ncbi:MAG: cell division protein ZapB [Treponema sp.]|nr:cell division protein ZapB [Treponema sp.]
MITLDQVLLLEQKVESAVKKIEQLKSENDALRKKCSELTNALSEKTEQLSSYVSNQNKIESGIRTALDRLNSIENFVLTGAESAQTSSLEINQTNNPIEQTENKPSVNNSVAQTNATFEELENVNTISENPKNEIKSDVESLSLIEESEDETEDVQDLPETITLSSYETPTFNYNDASQLEKPISFFQGEELEPADSVNETMESEDRKIQNDIDSEIEEGFQDNLDDSQDELGFDIF